MHFNQARFLEILAKLITAAEVVQNRGAQEPIPREREIVNIVRSYLDKHADTLDFKEYEYYKDRPNLIITRKGTGTRTVGLIGSHLDVVPANPAHWKRNPFQLIVEGDVMYGRGTTDCIGHVAALTEFLLTLSEQKIQLATTIVVLFMANEESLAITDIGIERLVPEGHLDMLKGHTALWLDCSDSELCIATKGVATWTLTVKGKRAHSGYPEKGINALTLACTIIDNLQTWFYKTIKHAPEGKKLKMTPPSMSPTLVSTTNDAVNAIPAEVMIKGDLRVPPGHNTQKLIALIKEHLPALVPKAKKPHNYENSEVSIEFASHVENPFWTVTNTEQYKQVARALKKAGIPPKTSTSGGTLPAIGDLQQRGVTIFATGFGKGNAYHQDNEYALISDFMKGLDFLWHYVSEE